MVCWGLGTKNTWLGSGKDHVSALNACFGHHKQDDRCTDVSLKVSSGFTFTNIEMKPSHLPLPSTSPILKSVNNHVTWKWCAMFGRNVNKVCSLCQVEKWTYPWFAEALTAATLSCRLDRFKVFLQLGVEIRGIRRCNFSFPCLIMCQRTFIYAHYTHCCRLMLWNRKSSQ